MTNKIVVAALFAIGIGCTSEAQKIKESNVPEPVKVALKKAFPDAKKVGWEKEGKGIEASFDNGKDEMLVVFDTTGNIIETEKEIEFSDLPAKVQGALKGKKVKEAAIIMRGNKTMYEAEVGGKDLLFDEEGNPIE
ncbi:MAG: hypothetical protein ACJAZY_001433 [Spirosomataceae bacterium]|jgi:hypothetical protein